MRHINPVLDYVLRERELERKAEKAMYTLKLDDFLIEHLHINGQVFDLKMDARYSRQGTHGDIVLEEFKMGTVYIFNENSFVPHIKVDQDEFKSRHSHDYDAIRFAGEVEAERLAARSDQWVQEDCE